MFQHVRETKNLRSVMGFYYSFFFAHKKSRFDESKPFVVWSVPYFDVGGIGMVITAASAVVIKGFFLINMIFNCSSCAYGRDFLSLEKFLINLFASLQLGWATTYLPRKDGSTPLSVLPKDTTSKKTIYFASSAKQGSCKYQFFTVF